jgi:hypothetical protein
MAGDAEATSAQKQSGDLCLVIGASGFLVTWVSKYLVQGGYRVRCVVRSLRDTDQLQTLELLLPGVEFIEANMCETSGWRTAIEGCKWVFHVSDPNTPCISSAAAIDHATVSKLGLTSFPLGLIQKVVVAPSGTEITCKDASNPCLQKFPHIMHQSFVSKHQFLAICPGLTLGSTVIPSGCYSMQLMTSVAGDQMPAKLPDMTLNMVDVHESAHIHVVVSNSVIPHGHTHISFSAVGKKAADDCPAQPAAPVTPAPNCSDPSCSGSGPSCSGSSSCSGPNPLMWALKFVSPDVFGVYSKL